MHTKKVTYNSFFTSLRSFDIVELMKLIGNRLALNEADIEYLKGIADKASHNLSKLNSCILITDIQTLRFLYVTSSVQHVTGYSAKEFISHGVSGFMKNYCPADRTNGQKALNKIISHQKDSVVIDKSFYQYITTFRFLNKKGYYTWIYNRMMFVGHDINNQPRILLSFFTGMDQFKNNDKINFSRLKFQTSSGKYEIEMQEEYEVDYTSFLNATDLEILKYLTEGMDNNQIAMKMNLTENTIKDYRKKMLRKTWCENTAELLCFALKNELL